MKEASLQKKHEQHLAAVTPESQPRLIVAPQPLTLYNGGAQFHQSVVHLQTASEWPATRGSTKAPSFDIFPSNPAAPEALPKRHVTAIVSHQRRKAVGTSENRVLRDGSDKRFKSSQQS